MIPEDCACGCGKPAIDGNLYAASSCRQRAYASRLLLATGATSYQQAARIRRSHRETLPVDRLLAELAAEEAP